MPTIRRLLPALLLLPLAATPAAAQSLAATDLLPVQASPGAPPRPSTPSGTPPAASAPAGPRTPEATPPSQSFPSRGGGYQCERSRPTS